ncbi:Demethylrebeccamycin-D-glucose O-methyltransferase [Thiorhodovibrio winogradskyi]|uniref:Demethylrebeccamycin-D-glucose O-methyltransferase n=1 Tax=Thiorhodovibrio winogradskyi TaxID=77007 RepID=A0ABZ0SFT1_9GAMM|nr:methyltransferase domain-containing protein [Thiorhodovibrio winogradskyi]
MEDYQLLIELHKAGQRQGPGGDEESAKALDMALLDGSQPLHVADIGCGTGASTLVLARRLNARITAVDFLQDFLDLLAEKAKGAGLSQQIQPLCCSMDALPFGDQEFDLIWSEGAIYNIGFERGISDWRRYLKVGGMLVVSEITWTTASRPLEIQRHWEREYPEINVASAKMQQLEKQGYAPMGYFVLPENCWRDNYYRPMQKRFPAFLERHGHSNEAQAIVAAETEEIELYEKYKAYYSYGVYIAKKLD